MTKEFKEEMDLHVIITVILMLIAVILSASAVFYMFAI
jgi:hypothetical protein